MLRHARFTTPAATRSALLALTIALSMGAIVSLVSLGPVRAATNLISNYSFEQTGKGLSPWVLSTKTGAAAKATQDGTTRSVGSYSAAVSVTATTGSSWLVQLSQPNIRISAGQSYLIEFSAKASGSRSIDALIQQTASPYTTFATRTFLLTTSWARY